MTKTEATRRIKREITPVKSRLIQLCNKLGDEGLASDHKRLGNIIANLEDWQNS